MKIQALLLSVAASFAAFTTAPANAALPVSAPRQYKYEEFVQKFDQARKINAIDEMASLVRRYHVESALHVEQVAHWILEANREEHEIAMSDLRKAWRKAYDDSRFVDWIYEYVSLLDPASKKERTRVRATANDAIRRMGALEQKDSPPADYELLAGTFQGCAEQFEELGDRFWAGKCWQFYGNCNDENHKKEDAELFKATDGWRRALEHYKAVEYAVVPRAKELKNVYELKVAAGYGAPPDDADAPVGAVPTATSDSPSLQVSMSFSVLESVDQFERPSYFADPVYQVWPAVFLKGNGSTGTFPAIDNGPMFIRKGSAELVLDVDRDGIGDVEVPIKGKIVNVTFDVGAGREKRTVAFAAVTGEQQDNYQGVQVNMQPDDNQMSLYYTNAGSVVGDANGTRLRVIDDNFDGKYGSEPLTWNYVGLSEGVVQPDFDSVVIGDSERAVPWSQYQKVGDQWYEFVSLDGGTELQLTPVEFKTGKLKLAFKGGKPDYVVVQGQKKLKNCLFDLLATPGGVEVPEGSYKIYAGALRKGKKQQMMKALIVAGEGAQLIVARPGEETVVEMGAPFRFDFKASVTEDSVTVDGKSVAIIGKGGERYERTWKCVPEPAVSYRKAGTKRGSKPEEMALVLDLQAVDSEGRPKYTWDDSWRPLDVQLDIKKKVDKVEVQLVEKKNKLFGKIESVWK